MRCAVSRQVIADEQKSSRKAADSLRREQVPAVRYAADDDCPAGCGHPEPAVLARWHWPGSGCCAAIADDGAGHPEMGSDVPAEQRPQGFDPLRCCGQGGPDRGGFSEPAEGADIWPGPAAGSADGFTAVLIGGWSRSREIFGACGRAAGRGYPVCGAAFGGSCGPAVGLDSGGLPRDAGRFVGSEPVLQPGRWDLTRGSLSAAVSALVRLRLA